jgi:hypothetical protein
MARGRKKVTVIEEPEEIDELMREGDEKSAEEIADENAIAKLQETFGEKQYRIRILKLNIETSEWEICEVFPLDRFDPMSLQKKWGGGKYRGQVIDTSQQYVKGGAVHFSLATPLIPIDEPKNTNPLQDPVVALIIDSMKSQQQNMIEMFKAFAPQTSQQMSPMMILEMLKSFRDMVPTEKGDNLEKILGLQLKIRDLFDTDDKDDDKASGGTFSEIVEAMKLLKESQTLMGPRVAPPNGPVPRRIVLPNGNLPNGNGSQLPVKTEEKEDMFAEVKNSILFYVPKFVQGAVEHGTFASNGQMTEADENIDRWGGFLINVLETETIPLAVRKMRLFIKNADQAWDFLIEWAEDKEKLEKIFVAAPELLPYRDWSLAVIASAVAEINTPDEPEYEEPTPAVVIGNGELPTE